MTVIDLKVLLDSGHFNLTNIKGMADEYWTDSLCTDNGFSPSTGIQEVRQATSWKLQGSKVFMHGPAPIRSPSLTRSRKAHSNSDGIDEEKLEWVKELKNERRGRISEYAEHFRLTEYLSGKRPWSVPCDLAFPSVTQNEIGEDDAKQLVRNGCYCVSEGANMPSTPEAVELFHNARILYGPGKASNAGGVAVSGLEMNQNAGYMWSGRKEIDNQLRGIMHSIHENCVRYGRENDSFIDYARGANIAGFIKVAEAMLQQGLV